MQDYQGFLLHLVTSNKRVRRQVTDLWGTFYEKPIGLVNSGDLCKVIVLAMLLERVNENLTKDLLKITLLGNLVKGYDSQQLKEILIEFLVEIDKIQQLKHEWESTKSWLWTDD